MAGSQCGDTLESGPAGPVMVWEQAWHIFEIKAGTGKARILSEIFTLSYSPVVLKMLHLCVNHSLIFLFCLNTVRSHC